MKFTKNKTVMIFLLFLFITILSACIVSANDTSAVIDNTTYSGSDISYKNNQTVVVDEHIKENTKNHNNKLSKSSNQFKSSGNNTLTSNLKLDGSVTITGDFTLNGNGYTITGNGESFESDKGNYTIHIFNVNFVNSKKSIFKLDGGSTIIIENCTFKDFKKCPIDSGKDTGTVEIRNCVFENNVGVVEGKACSIYVENCTIKSCTVDDGLIYAKKGCSIYVSDTSFSNCESPAFYISEGGLYYSNVTINGQLQSEYSNNSKEFVIDKDGGSITPGVVQSNTTINIYVNNTSVNTRNLIVFRLMATLYNIPVSDALLSISLTEINGSVTTFQRATDENGYVYINKNDSSLTFKTAHAGVVCINVSYEGSSGVYFGSNASRNYTVSKDSDKDTVAINIDAPKSVVSGQSVTISVSITDSNGNKINPDGTVVKINSTTYTTVKNNNSLILVYNNTNEGSIIVNVEYNGNTQYLGTSESFTITVRIAGGELIATSIIPEDDGMFTGSTATDLPVKFKIVDANGNEIHEGMVSIFGIDDDLNDVNITSVDLSTGSGVVYINSLSDPIGYDEACLMTLYYSGTDIYAPCEEDVVVSIFTLVKTTSELSVYASDSYVNSPSMINVTLSGKGRGIYNEEVSVTIDGTTKTYITDRNGSIIITDFVSSSVRNNILVSAIYDGNTREGYSDAGPVSTVFNVKEAGALSDTQLKIDASDSIVGVANSINVTLTSNNKTLYDEEVTVIVDNITYLLKTDINGKISITNFTLNTPKDDILVIASYTGNTAKGYKAANNTTATFNIKPVGEGDPIETIIVPAGDGMYDGVLGIDFNISVNVVDINGNEVHEGTLTLIDLTSDLEIGTLDLSTNNRTITVNSIKDPYEYNAAYLVTWYYSGTSVYAESEKDIVISILTNNTLETELQVNVSDTTVGVPTTIYVNLTTGGRGIFDEEVIISIDGVEHTARTNRSGVATYIYTSNTAKNYIPVIVRYEGNLKDKGYTDALDQTTFFNVKNQTNTQIDTYLTVNASDTVVNVPNKIDITLRTNNSAIPNAEVILVIDGISHTLTTNSNGEISYTDYLSTIPRDDIVVTVKYNGNNSTGLKKAEDVTTTFNVKQVTDDSKINTTVIPEGTGMYEGTLGTDFSISVKVVDINGNEVHEGTVTLVDYTTDLEIGTVDLSSNNKSVTINTIKDPYEYDSASLVMWYYSGTQTYNPSEQHIVISIFTHKAMDTTLTVKASDTIVGEETTINVTLTTDGIGIFDEEISLIIDGVEHTARTDRNGTLVYNYTPTYAKDNMIITAKYAGNYKDKGYNDALDQITFINVTGSGTPEETNITTKLTVTATNTVTGSFNTITITLTGNNEALAGEEVILIIDGVNHTLTTNSDGKIIYTNYTSHTVKTNVNVTVKYLGNPDKKYSNASDVTTRFNVSDSSILRKATIVVIDDDNVLEGKTGEDIKLMFEVVDEDWEYVTEGSINIIEESTGFVIANMNLSSGITSVYINTMTSPLKYQEEGYFILLEYSGSEHYDSASDYVLVLIESVEYISSMIKVQASTTVVGVPNQIRVTLTGYNYDGEIKNLYGEEVSVDIDGTIYNVVTDINGRAVITNYTPYIAKEVTVKVTYAGNEYKGHSSVSNNTTFNVIGESIIIKNATNISVNGIINNYVDEVELNISVIDSANNNVTEGKLIIKKDNVTLTTVNITSINTLVKIPVLSVGNHNLSIEYEDNEKYYNSSITTLVTVIAKETHITADIINKTVDNVTFIVSVYDNYNNSINMGNITIKSGEKIIGRGELINDSIVIVTDISQIGIYDFEVLYESNNKYNSNSTTENITNITVIRRDAVLEAVILNDSVNNSVKITLLDSITRNPVTNREVIVKAENYTLTGTTDSDGVVIIPLKSNIGKNIIELLFIDTYNKYNNITLEKGFDFEKTRTILTLNVNDTTFNKTIVITGTLRDVNEINLSNKTVLIFINGNNTSNTTTNVNGVFIYESLTNNVGSNIITVMFKGDNQYSDSEITHIITVNKLSSTITLESNADKFGNIIISGVLSDENNNKLSNAPIIIDINGNLSIAMTDNNGKYNYNHSSIFIGLSNITVKYNGDELYLNSTNKTGVTTSKIDTKITLIVNDAYLNTKNTISGILLDINGKTIKNVNIEVKINSENVTLSTDDNGMYIYEYTPNIVGINNISAIYTGNEVYVNTSINSTFNVEKLNNTIEIEKHNTTLLVSVTNTTLGENSVINGTLKDDLNNPIENAEVLVIINGLTRDTVKTNSNGSFNYNHKPDFVGNNNINIVYNGNDTNLRSEYSSTFNVSKIKTRLTINTTQARLGNTNLTGYLRTSTGSGIIGAVITIRLDNTVIGNIITGSNGLYFLNCNITTVGSHTFNASYIGNGTYDNSSVRTNLSLSKLGSSVSVDKITSWVNNSVVLTAHVKDSSGKDATNGSVTFRINGINLVNATVINGTAKSNYTVPTSWINTTRLSAVFNGNNILNSATSSNVTLNITLRNATVTLLTEAGPFHAGETMTLRLLIKEGDNLVNNGQVTFKLNGITLRDEKGNAIYGTVKDGVGIVKYVIPQGYLATTYNLTAVFGGGIYLRHETTSTITIVKSSVHINPVVISTNSSTARLSTTILNGNNVAVTGKTQISVKVSGSTIASGVNVTNGIINISLNTNFKTGVYPIEIIIGENFAYEGTRATTYLIKT